MGKHRLNKYERETILLTSEGDDTWDIYTFNTDLKNRLEYIEIDVPSYPVGISCKGVYHYRSGSTKQILTGPALEAFLLRKHGATWDNSPMPAFTMDDVDDNVVAAFKKLAAKKGRIDSSLLDEPKEVMMDRLHLINGDYLTNAAMLLFSKDPERYQLGAFLKIGYFETDADLLYQDEVHGWNRQDFKHPSIL